MNAVEYNGYKIEGDGSYGHKVIKSLSKGALPMVLRGTFTNFQFAKKAIDRVVAEKEVVNGKSTSIETSSTD